MYMIDGFGDGAAMISRMHHCIADGIALARVMLSLTDAEPRRRDRGGRDVGEAVRAGGRFAARGRSGASAPRRRGRIRCGHGQVAVDRTLAHPCRALSPAPSRATRATAVRLLLTPADAATAIKGEPGSQPARCLEQAPLAAR